MRNVEGRDGARMPDQEYIPQHQMAPMQVGMIPEELLL